jgi:hypothetical protein
VGDPGAVGPLSVAGRLSDHDRAWVERAVAETAHGRDFSKLIYDQIVLDTPTVLQSIKEDYDGKALYESICATTIVA